MRITNAWGNIYHYLLQLQLDSVESVNFSSGKGSIGTFKRFDSYDAHISTFPSVRHH